MMVVDASFVLKLFLEEPDSYQVRAQWQGWTQAGETIVAPPLVIPETLSVLRRSVHRGVLSQANGDRAFAALEIIEIDVREPAGLYRVAWQMAQKFNRPTIYDCCYLGLAQMSGCDLWTADRRLFNAVSASLSWVKSL